MRINKKYQKEFQKEILIRKSHTERFVFNFSFLTKDSKYNLDKSSKNITKQVRLKLLEKIHQLSQSDIVTVLNWDKSKGLEKLPESQVSLYINSEFKKTGRYDECDEDYWIFRLSSNGRVIGKKNGNIFYIMAVDASFDLYKH